jgi:CRISPR-associated RAMP protein (TIGR02581 family)
MSDDLFRRLERRYLVTGVLELRTALHIGGGDAALGTTDSPVLRRADGVPYIPGSSLKGAFRSTVEKLAATLELPNMDIDALDTGSDWMRKFNDRRRNEDWDEIKTVRNVAAEWPVTAQLFGTLYTAGKISFKDAYLLEEQDVVVQRRDGVAIDRDSERAMDRLKYDYEVVPPTLRFDFELLLENPNATDLGLACLGLSELRSGFFSLGGKRSSGLGRCALVNAAAYELDLSSADPKTRADRLKKYLKGKKPADKFSPIANVDTFLDESIGALLEGAA